jgi:hypothetical protein
LMMTMMVMMIIIIIIKIIVASICWFPCNYLCF